MFKGEYVKIPDEKVISDDKVISVSPESPPPMYEQSELVHGERSFDAPAPSFCLLSTFSFLCCFSPAGLLGMYYGHRTNKANSAGDYASAHKYSRYAKKAMRWSVAIGIICTVLALFGHVAFVGQAMHTAKHSFKQGYRAGMPQGKELGRSEAAKLVAANGPVTGLPSVLPTLPGNVFDVNDPFYHLGSMEAMAAYAGEHFGYTDGFRVGYCHTEGVTCSEQESHTLRWYKHHGCHGKKHGRHGHKGEHGHHDPEHHGHGHHDPEHHGHGHREHEHHEHGHREHEHHEHGHREHEHHEREHKKHQEIAEHIKQVEKNLGVDVKEMPKGVDSKVHAMHVKKVIADLQK